MGIHSGSMKYLVLFVMLFSRSACANILAVGLLSWDPLIPGDAGAPGVSAFNIANFTGDPNAGGDAIPPTFPIVSSLRFLNSALVLTSAGGSQNFQLGDIGPGTFSLPALEFPDSADFSSAVFTASLDTSSFALDGGDLMTADSRLVTALMLPSVGSSLVAGNDSILITVSAEPSALPEPSTFHVLSLALVWMVLRYRLRSV
jgi:hypothetical protein